MFTISFATTWFRPDLQVTVRTDVDGWVDIAGNYEDDAWSFRLPIEPYAQGMQFKFVLQEQYWMVGPNLALLPVDGETYVSPRGSSSSRR